MDVDDILGLILERIDSPITLISAAAACKRWRRIIADAGFLRRHRSLHGPPVAGGYNNGCRPILDARGRRKGGHQPLFVPSSSSINGRHFSLDFVVSASIFEPRGSRTRSWKVRDSRGSLLLMQCTVDGSYCCSTFPDMVVCEPLTRRYMIVPTPPAFKNSGGGLLMFRGPYLIDGGDNDGDRGRIGMSNFKLLCLIFRNCVVRTTAVFTAGGNTWSEKAVDPVVASWFHHGPPSELGRMLGSWYFYVRGGTLIALDGSTGEFSSSALPPLPAIEYWKHDYFDVVDGGDGEPRILTVVNHTMRVFARLDGEWALENEVLLSKVAQGLPGYRRSFFYEPLTIVTWGVGFVVMSATDDSIDVDPPSEQEQHWSFSIDLKTMEVAPAAKGMSTAAAYRCEFPWPPVLQACLD